MDLLAWLKKEKININEIEIRKSKTEFIVFGCYSIFFIFVVFVFSLIIKHYPITLFEGATFTKDFWYLFCIKIIFLFTVPLLIFKLSGYSILSVFNSSSLSQKDLIAIAFLFSFGCLLNFSHISSIKPLFVIDNIAKILFGILIPLITAAVPEEIFYRYILQTRIEKLLGWLPSILLSSILFTLFHFPSRYLLSKGLEGVAGDIYTISVGTLIPVFIIGIILGFIWNRYRNIYFLISLHYGIDFLPSISSVLGTI